MVSPLKVGVDLADREQNFKSGRMAVVSFGSVGSLLELEEPQFIWIVEYKDHKGMKQRFPYPHLIQPRNRRTVETLKQCKP